MLKRTEDLLRALAQAMENHNSLDWDEVVEDSYRTNLGSGVLTITKTTVDEWSDEINEFVSADAFHILIRNQYDRVLDDVTLKRKHSLYDTAAKICEYARAKVHNSETTLEEMLNAIPKPISF